MESVYLAIICACSFALVIALTFATQKVGTNSASRDIVLERTIKP
jgi:hypothetical protein